MATGTDWTRAWSPDALADRAARAADRTDADLAVAIVDFFLPDAARLDERTRAMLGETVRGVVRVAETAICRHAARLLADRGRTERAESLLRGGTDAMVSLLRAGALRDPELMRELIARVRQDMVAEALPVRVTGADESSLLFRLAAAPDMVVARAASALLTAENRRRTAWEQDQPIGTELPDDLHRRLVWRVAAAIRDGDEVEVDRAIVEAALRTIAAHDEDERADAVAMRLAVAIDPRPAELPGLLIEALGDRRPGLFAAFVAHALGLRHEQARALTLDADDDRLWMALRALSLDRRTIAEVGLALSEADPARDIETFADQLDAIVAVSPEEAHTALAPMMLHPDYRAAIRLLAHTDER